MQAVIYLISLSGHILDKHSQGSKKSCQQREKCTSFNMQLKSICHFAEYKHTLESLDSLRFPQPTPSNFVATTCKIIHYSSSPLQFENKGTLILPIINKGARFEWFDMVNSMALQQVITGYLQNGSRDIGGGEWTGILG